MSKVKIGSNFFPSFFSFRTANEFRALMPYHTPEQNRLQESLLKKDLVLARHYEEAKKVLNEHILEQEKEYETQKKAMLFCFIVATVTLTCSAIALFLY